MPRKRKQQKNSENNGKLGWRPVFCRPCQVQSPVTLDEDSDSKQYFCEPRIIYEDSDDEDELVVENNTWEYENRISDKVETLLTDIDEDYDAKVGSTRNFGIRKGCGTSERTQQYIKKRGADLLTSAEGCKRMEAYFQPTNGNDTDDEMHLAVETPQMDNDSGFMRSEKSRMKYCIVPDNCVGGNSSDMDDISRL